MKNEVDFVVHTRVILRKLTKSLDSKGDIKKNFIK